MRTEEIIIRVDSDVAHAYKVASEEDRRKLDLLVSLRLREATGPRRSLKELMHELSRKAQKRGLTPAILDSILNEK